MLHDFAEHMSASEAMRSSLLRSPTLCANCRPSADQITLAIRERSNRVRASGDSRWFLEVDRAC